MLRIRPSVISSAEVLSNLEETSEQFDCRCQQPHEFSTRFTSLNHSHANPFTLFVSNIVVIIV